MIEGRIEVREGDILIILTGYHHFGWDQPRRRPTRCATWPTEHPGLLPRREFAEWCKAKKIKWIGVDCGSADHPMLALGLQAQVNKIIRNRMPRQAAEADKLFRAMYGASLEERPDWDRRQVPVDVHQDVSVSHHPRRVHWRRRGSGVQPAGCAATIGFSRNAH